MGGMGGVNGMGGALNGGGSNGAFSNGGNRVDASTASMFSGMSPGGGGGGGLTGGGGGGGGDAGGEDDLEVLLRRLGLEKHLAHMHEQDIDSVSALRLLTDEDLKEMKFSIGVRRKLFDALQQSGGGGGGGAGAGGGGGVNGGMAAPSPGSAFSFM